MSDLLEKRGGSLESEPDAEDEIANKGPNLILLYCLLALALLAAMAFAAMVVWPFYKAR